MGAITLIFPLKEPVVLPVRRDFNMMPAPSVAWLGMAIVAVVAALYAVLWLMNITLHGHAGIVQQVPGYLQARVQVDFFPAWQHGPNPIEACLNTEKSWMGSVFFGDG